MFNLKSISDHAKNNWKFVKISSSCFFYKFLWFFDECKVKRSIQKKVSLTKTHPFVVRMSSKNLFLHCQLSKCTPMIVLFHPKSALTVCLNHGSYSWGDCCDVVFRSPLDHRSLSNRNLLRQTEKQKRNYGKNLIFFFISCDACSIKNIPRPFSY